MNTRQRACAAGDPAKDPLPVPAGSVQLETFLPWTVARRKLRKAILPPPGAEQAFVIQPWREAEQQDPKTDTPLMRALGLAHHWQRLLDEGKVTSVAEIAKAEGMDVTQVRRLLRLALLPPKVVERLVETPGVTLGEVIRGK
jgi:hypothetical protein